MRTLVLTSTAVAILMAASLAFAAQIVGTDGPDNLSGTVEDDQMSGRGGDDVLRGGDGEDGLDGGAGNDRLFGDATDDVLVGEVIQCSSPNACTPSSFGVDHLDGGGGEDELYASFVLGCCAANVTGADNGTLIGGSGDDDIFGSNGRGHDLGRHRRRRGDSQEGATTRSRPATTTTR